MFAQSVDENIGGAIDKASQNASNTGELLLILGLVFIGVFAIFLLIAYFIRSKTLSKSERKSKVLRLP